MEDIINKYSKFVFSSSWYMNKNMEISILLLPQLKTKGMGISMFPIQSFKKHLQTKFLQFLLHKGVCVDVYNLAEKLFLI